MTAPGTYSTEVGDMFAVHQSITATLDSGAGACRQGRSQRRPGRGDRVVLREIYLRVTMVTTPVRTSCSIRS